MSVFSPSNSIWPSNGIIGSEQIQIPDGVNEKWPEGDALVGNFVYKEGKLTGFVDCKSLVINDSKSTIIPYDYAELELPSILKDTMVITGGERCKNLIISCLEDAAVYITPMLKEILGDAKFITEFIKEENKLIVHTDRLDDETLVNVNELLERVLPQNIVIQRANYLLPAEYKWVEYLGGTGTQWIDTGIKLSNEYEVKCDFLFSTFIQYGALFGARDALFTNSFLLFTNVNGTARFDFASSQNQLWNIEPSKLYSMLANKSGIIINENERAIANAVFEGNHTCFVFGVNSGGSPMIGSSRIYSFSISRNSQLQCNLIPCLDVTGTPCMYDLVSGEAFYNQGAGDFLYPTNAAPAAAIGMDDKFYAKLTEHGVRRLYKVPDGCNMTKDEYAAANGFKEIVEPPMPQTGYWMPEWRETNTQLILQWIETEEPIL